MSFLKRLFGPPDVGALKAKGNVRGLLRALSYEKQWDVRAASARALGEIGGAEAVVPLTACLEDSCRRAPALGGRVFDGRRHHKDAKV